MSKQRRRDQTAEEQHILEHGHLQLLSRPEEAARCDEAIVEHHYPRDPAPA